MNRSARGLRFRYVVTCVLLAVGTVHAQIQLAPNAQPPVLGNDTLCFRYRFEPGDSVTYQIEAADSIAFVGEPTLLKIRKETVLIVCDSVLPSGAYALQVRWLEANEKSVTATDSSRIRTTHPWTSHTVFLAMDSLGHRLPNRSEQSTKAVVAPGGAFQPLLLPPLDSSCGGQNQSWLYRDTMVLIENATPPPVLDVMYLWRVQDFADTLGKKYTQIQYTQSGVGQMSVTADRTTFNASAVIAGYGKLTFDPDLQLPYHMYATVQAKLELEFPNGVVREGIHHSMMNMHCKEVRRHGRKSP